MRILISGSSGFVGRALMEAMPEHTWVPLVRDRRKQGIFWSIEQGVLESRDLEGFDAVVHLAGESLFGLWTERKRREIEVSRVKSTQLLVRGLAKTKKPPKIFISTSAIGYYGNCDEPVDETGKKGSGFLADVCKKWEESARVVKIPSCRLIIARFGIVLSNKGGILAKLTPLFKWGLGGRIGDGSQKMSCIALDDLVNAYKLFLSDKKCRGIYNLTAPKAITNAQFTKSLAKSLERPAFCHLPKWVVHLIFGQMGRELLLASSNARPARLIATGFSFK